MKFKPPNAVRGLWWLAFLIVLAGGLLAYNFSLNEIDPSSKRLMGQTIMVTTVLAGICLIAATAKWWLRH
jgi:hypothetical protein